MPEIWVEFSLANSNMAHSEKSGSWRGHVGWLVGQLIVVFAGVSAAFVVENYRDSKNQQADLVRLFLASSLN